MPKKVIEYYDNLLPFLEDPCTWSKMEDQYTYEIPEWLASRYERAYQELRETWKEINKITGREDYD